VIKVGDLVTVPYLYSDSEHGPGVVLAAQENGDFRSKKFFILWSAPEGYHHPVKEWVDGSLLEKLSNKKEQE
tara:strand:- start:1090 stop:1305 length:216 start_codon:yes stop_codon:yes gene_type:complete